MLFVWNVIERFLPILIQFISYLAITSSMEPELVGVLGIVNLFIALSQVIIDGGLSTIIIKDQARNKILLTTVFYLVMTISLIVYFSAILLSYVVESYLEIKGLPHYLMYAALILPISGLGVVSRSILVVRDEYKAMTKMAVASSTISFVVAYTMAEYGYEIWSLITLSLVFNMMNTIQIIFKSKYRPTEKVDFTVLLKERVYVINVLCTNLIDGLFRNVYSIVVVKYFNLYNAGLYNQSQKITDLPSYNLYAVIYRFVFSRLSIEEDVERKKKILIRYTKLVLLCTTPFYFAVYVYADVIIDLLLGEKWIDMVTVFSILVLSGLLYPVKAIFSAYFHSIGHGKKVLMVEIIHKVCLFVNIFVAVSYNIETMAYGVFMTSLLIISLMVLLSAKNLFNSVDRVRL